MPSRRPHAALWPRHRRRRRHGLRRCRQEWPLSLRKPDPEEIMSDPSRRSFLAAAPALLAAQSPNDTIRVAFIGVGNRGSFVLSHALKVPGAKIVALCDLDEERLSKAKRAAEPPGHTPVTDTDFLKRL